MRSITVEFWTGVALHDLRFTKQVEKCFWTQWRWFLISRTGCVCWNTVYVAMYNDQRVCQRALIQQQTKSSTPVPGILLFVEKTKIWLNLYRIWHYRIIPALVCPLHPALHPPHPFMVTEFDRELCDDVIKLRSRDENIRFIRERPLGVSKGVIEKMKQESSK